MLSAEQSREIELYVERRKFLVQVFIFGTKFVEHMTGRQKTCTQHTICVIYICERVDVAGLGESECGGAAFRF